MECYFKLVIHDAFAKSLNDNLSYYEQNYYNFFCKVVRQAYASMNILKTFPYIYPVFYKTNDKEYRKIIINNHFIIVYYIENRDVHIIYFFDGRQESQKLFRLL